MYSLQSRLAWWLGIMLIVLFGLHLILISHFPRYLAEERVLTRLQHDSDSLENRLMVRANGLVKMRSGPVSPIYRTPQSGHYFQVQQGDHLIRSPSLAEKRLSFPELGKRTHGVFRTEAADAELLLMWVSKAHKEGADFTIIMAEEITDIQEDISAQQKIYFFGTLLTLLTLILLQTWIIRKNLKPVEQARQELASIEQGKLSQIQQQVPQEIQPLVDELNHLLEALQKRLNKSRMATGNLAHALKTPLSVLRQLTESKEVRNHPELLEDLNHVTDSIQKSIERELKRARLSGSAVIGQRFEVKTELDTLIEIMGKVYAHKNLHFDVSIPANKSIQADREDMLELCGNLLDNACKWTKSTVKVTVADKTSGLHCLIEDDGPGIQQDEQQLMTQRGTRLDESTPGHGLGLAIVKEIVEQWEGSIEFKKSEALGGLAVEIKLANN